MKRLVVLRPEPGASETVKRATALGFDARAIPLFRVEAVDWQAPDPRSFDGLLLTSANALRYGGKGMTTFRALPVHAVGDATAAAAREAGFVVRSTGEDGAERLLASIAAELKLLHPCGEHRTAVTARQSIVAIPVYRSMALPAPDAFDLVEGAIVAVHSQRAAKRFAELARQAGIDRRSVRIAAISKATLAAAGDGWGGVEAADEPTDPALLAAAARLCDKGRHR